jgi:hypothetical protein
MMLVPAVEIDTRKIRESDLQKPLPPLKLNGKQVYAVPGGALICP